MIKLIDSVRAALTHQQDCADNTSCLLTKSCGITENHVSLCTSIINALSSIQTGNQPLLLNSEDRTKKITHETNNNGTNNDDKKENKNNHEEVDEIEEVNDEKYQEVDEEEDNNDDNNDDDNHDNDNQDNNEDNDSEEDRDEKINKANGHKNNTNHPNNTNNNNSNNNSYNNSNGRNKYNNIEEESLTPSEDESEKSFQNEVEDTPIETQPSQQRRGSESQLTDPLIYLQKKDGNYYFYYFYFI